MKSGYSVSGAASFAASAYKSKMSSTFANRRAKVVQETTYGNDTEVDLSGLIADNDTHPAVYGVVRIAIKTGKRILVDQFFPGSTNSFVRICSQNNSRKTRVSQITKGLASWNEVKHFPVEVNRNKRHPTNLMTIELYTFSGNIAVTEPPKLLGSVGFHLHDLVRAQHVRDEFNLYSGEAMIGALAIEITFTYGLFGYGYAPQMPDLVPANKALKRSLLPRVDPPRRRTDPRRQVMLAVATDTPSFIQAEPAILGATERIRQPEDIGIIEDFTEKFPLLSSQMTSLTKIREHSQTLSRHDRLQYLKQSMFDASRRTQYVSVARFNMSNHDTRPFMKYMQPARIPIGRVKAMGSSEDGPKPRAAKDSGVNDSPPMIMIEAESEGEETKADTPGAIRSIMKTPGHVRRRSTRNGLMLVQFSQEVDELEAERERRMLTESHKPRPRSPPPRDPDADLEVGILDEASKLSLGYSSSSDEEDYEVFNGDI
ncbi:hypothetical protein J8273_6642 [Carpediemonas membranifera]|uniref:C2 domain-containing protein n=1 Tax=Carpediemonas membranifera TaxID=201153 RepID=A0A8J6E0M8_9EUKA|nr:hypothetical protein J8273_6642 [Carpediemonas membranifera]|eukprot:KAG9392051.1 hypothetical protein J8273_6642 [Carpediemonas membranifera]